MFKGDLIVQPDCDNLEERIKNDTNDTIERILRIAIIQKEMLDIKPTNAVGIRKKANTKSNFNKRKQKTEKVCLRYQ